MSDVDLKPLSGEELAEYAGRDAANEIPVGLELLRRLRNRVEAKRLRSQPRSASLKNPAQGGPGGEELRAA